MRLGWSPGTALDMAKAGLTEMTGPNDRNCGWVDISFHKPTLP